MLLADCELVIASLETLYNLSFYGAEIAESILQVDNSIEILAHLLTTKVEDFNREALERMRLIMPNPQQLQLPTNHALAGSATANQISAVVNSAPMVVLPSGVHVNSVAIGTDSKMLTPTNQIQPSLLKAGNVGSPQLPSVPSLSLKLSQSLSQLLTHSNNSLPPVLTGKQIQDLLGQIRGEQKHPSTPSTPSLATSSPPILPILTGKQIQDLLLQVRGDPSTPSTPSPATLSPSTHTPNIPIPSSSVTNLKMAMLPSRVQSAFPPTKAGTNSLGLPKVTMQGDQFAQQW